MKALEKGTYDMLFYQHITEALTYSIWSDNNFVKTLSNFHQPVVSVGGVKRRKRGANGMRELHRTSVDCPEQVKEYCETFHWIDKGNQVEANFDLGGESKLHGWSPKLASRLFNMHLNNAYRIYCTLLQPLPYSERLISDCIADLTVDLLQQGEPMRTRSSGVPPTSSGTGEGRKVRSNAKSHFDNISSPRGRNHARTPLSPEAWSRSTAYKRKRSFESSLKKGKWRSHQSVATVGKNDGGHCQYDCCPGLDRTQNKRKRSYPTQYQCVECSIAKGRPVYLCNTIKREADGTRYAVLCHMKYHEQKFGASKAGDSSSDGED